MLHVEDKPHAITILVGLVSAVALLHHDLLNIGIGLLCDLRPHHAAPVGADLANRLDADDVFNVVLEATVLFRVGAVDLRGDAAPENIAAVVRGDRVIASGKTGLDGDGGEDVSLGDGKVVGQGETSQGKNTQGKDCLEDDAGDRHHDEFSLTLSVVLMWVVVRWSRIEGFEGSTEFSLIKRERK